MILKENRLPLINKSEDAEADKDIELASDSGIEADDTGLNEDAVFTVSQNESLRDVFIKFNTMFLKKFESLNSVLDKIDKNLEKGEDEKKDDNDDIKKGFEDINKNIGSLVKLSEEENKQERFRPIFDAITNFLSSLAANPIAQGAAAAGAVGAGGYMLFNKLKDTLDSIENGTFKQPWEGKEAKKSAGESELRKTIKEIESGNNPNASWNKWGGDTRFTEMTWEQVLQTQRKALRENSRTEIPGTYNPKTGRPQRSSAFGSGQLTSETVDFLIKSGAIKKDEKATAESQDVAIDFLIRKAAEDAKNPTEYRENITQRWESLSKFSADQLTQMSMPPAEAPKPSTKAEPPKSPTPVKTNTSTTQPQQPEAGFLNRLFGKNTTSMSIQPAEGYSKLEETARRDDEQKRLAGVSDTETMITQIEPQITTIDNSTTTVISRITPESRDESFLRGVSITGSFDAFRV